MPGADLISPPGDGAAETAHLGRHLWVRQVAADLGDPLGCELGVGVVIDLTNHLLSDNRPSGLVVSGVR
jgi:hypothetical protein